MLKASNRVSNKERYHYLEKIKPYKTTIQSLLKHEQAMLQSIKRSSKDAAFNRLMLAEEMIFLASNYIVLGGVYQSILKQRSEDALNDGRKSLYRAVIYLEEVVSPLIDAPFSEYEDRLAEIAAVSAQARYDLIRKLGLATELLETAYGDNTKWRWTFVELEGRFAAVAKNLMDLRSAVENTDPRSPDYEPTIYHLQLMKRLLLKSATRYREKYELSTNRIDDFKMGIHFLNALKRIHALMGERAEAEDVKKKAAIWSEKLEHDMKKQEEAAKRI